MLIIKLAGKIVSSKLETVKLKIAKKEVDVLVQQDLRKGEAAHALKKSSELLAQ